MTKIGIVGGISWQSTAEYYAQICRRSVPEAPEIAVESLVLSRAVAYFGRDEDEASWAAFDDYHRGALLRLQASGATVALIASNTPHHRFEQIVRGVGIPVVSMIDAVARACSRAQLNEVVLLGTALTMRSPVFCEGFARRGVVARGPADEDVRRDVIALIEDIQNERAVHAEARLHEIANRAVRGLNSKWPAVCLACTELPLAIGSEGQREISIHDGIAYVNTTLVHINAVLDYGVRQPQ